MPKSESKITIKVGDHPPCVMKLLEEAKKHENLPHHARWYLATYLLAIGTSEDDIAKIYSDLPDFSEKVTRYQVSHIKKKGYNVPSCSTVMTYGLCCAVCRIGHPMNWHGLSEDRKKSIKTSGA
jgi:DNA primase large subunit